MPFDPPQLDSLDDDGAAADDELDAGAADYEDELDDELDELEDDPSTWDLGAGRAAAHAPRRLPVGELDVAALIDLVLDGVQPDGTAASDELRAAAWRAWRDREPELARSLFVALTGTTLEGAPVAPEARQEAREQAERRRLIWLEPDSDQELDLTRSGKGRRPASANAVKITTRDGQVRFAQLGNDDAAVAQMAERIAGLPLAEIAGPGKPGRPTRQEQARLARQALVIHRLVAEHGATQAAVARVLGLSGSRVSQRATVGAKIAVQLARRNRKI